MNLRFRVFEMFGRQWAVCSVDGIVVEASVECEAVKENSLQHVITQLGDT